MADAKADDKKKDKKVKRPSALKNDLQNEQRRLRNRSYRATVHTAIRSFENSLAQKEASEAIQSKLNLICSLMDKGVKKGVFKQNKASRTKSRFTARVV
jgi:small subunit ribosomal protein S20